MSEVDVVGNCRRYLSLIRIHRFGLPFPQLWTLHSASLAKQSLYASALWIFLETNLGHDEHPVVFTVLNGLVSVMEC